MKWLGWLAYRNSQPSQFRPSERGHYWLVAAEKGFLSALLAESAKFTVVVSQNCLNNSPSEDPPQCETEPAENERGTDGT